MIKSLSEINFDDENCPFEKEYCFEYKNKVYELLPKEHFDHEFRVVLYQDDYDYVEDEKLIDELLEHCAEL